MALCVSTQYMSRYCDRSLDGLLTEFEVALDLAPQRQSGDLGFRYKR